MWTVAPRVVALALVLGACGSSSNEELYGAGGQGGSQDGSGGSAAGAGGTSAGAAGAPAAGTSGSGAAANTDSGSSGAGPDASVDAPATDDASSEGGPAGAGGTSGASADASDAQGNDPTKCPPAEPGLGTPCNVLINSADCVYGFRHCVCVISAWTCVP